MNQLVSDNPQLGPRSYSSPSENQLSSEAPRLKESETPLTADAAVPRWAEVKGEEPRGERRPPIPAKPTLRVNTDSVKANPPSSFKSKERSPIDDDPRCWSEEDELDDRTENDYDNGTTFPDS